MPTPSSVFSDDYAHFEREHARRPADAEPVFRLMAQLREALSAFRQEEEVPAEEAPPST